MVNGRTSRWLLSAGLYEVEKRARNVSPQERQALRLKESAPVLAQLLVWLEENKAAVAPKSPMGKAISYARSHWQALSRYLEDGVLEIDNNAAERALRRVALAARTGFSPAAMRAGVEPPSSTAWWPAASG